MKHQSMYRCLGIDGGAVLATTPINWRCENLDQIAFESQNNGLAAHRRQIPKPWLTSEIFQRPFLSMTMQCAAGMGWWTGVSRWNMICLDCGLAHFQPAPDCAPVHCLKGLDPKVKLVCMP